MLQITTLQKLFLAIQILQISKYLKFFISEKYFVSEIQYPDCYNFEGRKVLLTTFDPRNRRTLDPHFELDSGILARFEPTADGWIMAKQIAELSK